MAYFDTKSLFGTTPEELQRKIFEDSQLRRAKEMQFLAQNTTAPGYTYGMLQSLEPLRQQVANVGEDPRVTQLRERAAAAKEAFAGFDTSDPQAMRETASKLYRMGMPEQAVKLLNVARSLASGAPSDVQSIQFWEQRYGCDQYEDGSQEKKDCQLRAEETALARKRKTPEDILLEKYMADSGTSMAKSDITIREAAQSAPDAIAAIDQADFEIDAGNANTGIFEPILTTIDRAISAVAGSESKAAARVQSTQFLSALLGADVFKQIKALGIGARGLDTPAERKFLQEVITGAVTLDAGSIKKMNAIRRNMFIRAMRKYNKKFDNPQGAFKRLIIAEGLEPIDMSYYQETDIESLTVGQPQAPKAPEAKPEEGFKTVQDVIDTGFDVDGFVQAVTNGDIDMEQAKKDWKAEYPNVPFPVAGDM